MSSLLVRNCSSTLPERVFPAKVSRDLVDLVSLLSPCKALQDSATFADERGCSEFETQVFWQSHTERSRQMRPSNLVQTHRIGTDCLDQTDFFHVIGHLRSLAFNQSDLSLGRVSSYNWLTNMNVSAYLVFFCKYSWSWEEIAALRRLNSFNSINIIVIFLSSRVPQLHMPKYLSLHKSGM